MGVITLTRYDGYCHLRLSEESLANLIADVHTAQPLAGCCVVTTASIYRDMQLVFSGVLTGGMLPYWFTNECFEHDIQSACCLCRCSLDC